METDGTSEAATQTGEGRSDHVVVDGQRPVTLPVTREAAAGEFDLTTRTIGFRCASGDWLEDEWTGVPVPGLLERAAMPPETTHAVVEAADGYRVCVEIAALTDAMVAYDAAERPATDFPQFVSADVEGPQAVKNLGRIAPVELAPDEDPADYEHRQLNDS